jgi:plastocyanin domain-containing protein
MKKNTIISILISVLLIGATLYLIYRPASSGKTVTQEQNTTITDGVQYVTITAKGGYTPRMSEIASGIPTKLIVKTKNTYDCSASLVIRSVGFQKILQSTGEEVIDLGIPKAGDKIQGVCGMGMYAFQIKVN